MNKCNICGSAFWDSHQCIDPNIIKKIDQLESELSKQANIQDKQAKKIEELDKKIDMIKQNEAKKAMLDLCGILDDREERVEMPEGYDFKIIGNGGIIGIGNFQVHTYYNEVYVKGFYREDRFTKEQFQQLINDMQKLLDESK